ncbi:MAG: putative signal transduction protein with EFhand domain [Lacunisphaera sp.]|nr:putative signal transduction protein with EFhand domain [Lacunisphaera sp.]
MKARPFFIYLLTAAFLALRAPAQTAPEADPPEGSGRQARRRQEMLARYDKNGDGKLDAEEKAAMKADQVSLGELWKPGAENAAPGTPGPAALKAGDADAARIRDWIKRFDRDGDGKLDFAELTELDKARQQLQQNGGADRFRAQRLKMFDKDGDGVLNESERAEAEKFMAEQVKRFDRDGDGQLSAEERGEALKAFVAEHPDMMPPAK